MLVRGDIDLPPPPYMSSTNIREAERSCRNSPPLFSRCSHGGPHSLAQMIPIPSSWLALNDAAETVQKATSFFSSFYFILKLIPGVGIYISNE